jgi:hypothetical protein
MEGWRDGGMEGWREGEAKGKGVKNKRFQKK